MNTPEKNKLTPAQQEILDLLKNGWELGISIEHHKVGSPTRYWVQKGKVGHGGESRKVGKATVEALTRMNAIKKVARDPGRFHAIFEVNLGALPQ